MAPPHRPDHLTPSPCPGARVLHPPEAVDAYGYVRRIRAQDADVWDALEQHEHPIQSHAERLLSRSEARAVVALPQMLDARVAEVAGELAARTPGDCLRPSMRRAAPLSDEDARPCGQAPEF